MTLKRKLTPEEKAQIIHLHQTQGLAGPEIADVMKIDDPRQVVGVIRAAVNFKKIPGMKPSVVPGAPMTMPPSVPKSAPAETPTVVAPPEVQAPAPAPVIMMSGAAPSLPTAAPAPRLSAVPPVHVEPRMAPVHQMPAQPAPAASADGFGSTWAPAPGYASGFNYNAPARRYMVYRDEPQDGLLGEHADPFGEREVAATYGSGRYRILRFDPGNPRPFQTEFRVSQSYGAPKFAARSNSSERPGYGRWGQRPWFRSSSEASREEDGVNEPQYERPRAVYDFARHAPSQNSDATAAAIKALGDLNSKALDQVEQARRQGPDTFMSKFFSDQQAQWRDQLELQRRQDDQRRREDDERADRRQKEADREYQRRQEEEQKRHDREIEKIRMEMEARDKAREAERKMLIDLEDKRLQVIRDEHKMRQEALQEELKRNRDEQKEREARIEKQLSEIQQNTSAQMQEHEEKLQKELAREREQLDREQKLKEKHLDREHELNTKILEVKQQQLENQGTNEVFTVVNNLINKFSSGLKEVVDLKKIEAAGNMSPEAQAAAVVHTMGDGKRSAEPEPAPAAAAASAGQASGENGKNGHAATAGAQGKAQEEPPMEEMVQQMVEQPFFQKVLKEWALHVRTGQDATTFVNMYMNWMNDPVDHEGRKATTMFANFIAPRPWAELYAIIKPKLKPEIVKVFDTKDADDYYETFRGLVTESIRAYWENVAAEREAVKAARRAAAKPAEKTDPQPAK